VVEKPVDVSPQSAFSRFLSWFSKKEQDTTISKLIVDVETQIDTLRKSVMSPSDSLLSEVMQILISIQEQQEMSLYNISEMELELLQSDKEIMDQIRTVVSLLEREELMNSYKIAEQVREGVSKSTTLLLILGGTAFFLVILFITLIFRDISKATFYRNQLLQAKQYAEKLLKVKEEFLANMNHEIRTPLSAIIGLSRQLQRSVKDDSNKFYIDSLSSSSQHLLQIVNDILDLSKIEGNYIQFESIPFSPKEVVQDALNTFYLKAKEKGLETSITFESESQDLIIGDPFRLKQILFNLISNAIKFTSSGSISVDIKGKIKSDEEICYTFSISDTGIGIPAEKVDSVFDQFSQVDSSITRMYGGTGLGLTIVKKLTELQGGTVDVKSEVSNGTTFTVEITYRIAKDDQMVTKRSITNVKLPSELKIVVVDDDPIGQLLVTEMLKLLGVNPLVFDNVPEALSAIRKEKPSIVLTDIQMPEQSGFDLVNELNKLDSKNRPIIIALTANSMADNPAFYSSAGFQASLIKPFDEIDLYNTLAPHLNIKPIEQEQTSANGNNNTNGEPEYDISDIRRFAGNDNESTKAILQSFIDNSQTNLRNLVDLANTNDLQGLGEVAHRMKSAFRQLKVYKLSNTLEELENAKEGDLSKAELDSSIQSISKEVSKVQVLLKEDIDKL
jgi:signal transduction histidine kinase/ActR/RegA family two-component response regulator/HPt (histidine-containing phosphotransfer) domain-containing protein